MYVFERKSCVWTNGCVGLVGLGEGDVDVVLQNVEIPGEVIWY